MKPETCTSSVKAPGSSEPDRRCSAATFCLSLAGAQSRALFQRSSPFQPRQRSSRTADRTLTASCPGSPRFITAGTSRGCRNFLDDHFSVRTLRPRGPTNMRFFLALFGLFLLFSPGGAEPEPRADGEEESSCQGAFDLYFVLDK